MEPGSTGRCRVVLGEPLGRRPFAALPDVPAGSWIATGRIPIQAMVASIEAEYGDLSEGA